MINNDDEFAFPLKNALSNDQLGMTLRDYFAAKAMASVILDPWYSTQDAPFSETAQHIAEDAYLIADAMIKRRKK